MGAGPIGATEYTIEVRFESYSIYEADEIEDKIREVLAGTTVHNTYVSRPHERN